MKAYVLIEAAPGRVRDLLTDLAGKQRANSKVVSLDAVTGPYDLIAVVEGPDIDAIGTLVTEEIQGVPGVQRTLTCVSVHPR